MFNHVGCVSCYRVVQAYMQEKDDAGATVVLLSVSGGLVAAAFAILDCVRPSSVVSALQEMGVTVYMVTGEAQVCFFDSFRPPSMAYHSAGITEAGQRLGVLPANCQITQIGVMQGTIGAQRMLLPLQLASSMSWRRCCWQGKQNR